MIYNIFINIKYFYIGNNFTLNNIVTQRSNNFTLHN